MPGSSSRRSAPERPTTGRRTVLATVAAVFLAGCSGGGDGGGDGGTTATQDSDGDGVPDSEDYAPRDPDVQEASDVADDDPTTTETDGATATNAADDRDETPTDGADPTTTETARPEGDPDTVLDKRLTLSSGEQRAIRLSLEGPAVLEYEFQTEGLPIDVFLMARSEYELLRQNLDVDWFADGSTLDTNADRVVVDVEPLENDELVLVLDNSDSGEAGPSKNAVVEDAVDLRATVTVYR